MTAIEIYQIASPIFFSILVLLYNRKMLSQAKKDLSKKSDLLREDANDIDMYLSNAVDRKLKYLYKCLEANRIFKEPKYWTTKEENRMHEMKSEKRADLLKEIEHRINRN
jgi:hypothetical protein